MDISLIYTSGSNCAQRVAWALNYKGISYETIDAESLSPEEFVKVSPFKKVPSVLIDGKPLAESVAIIEFIEELFPSPALLPGTSWERAKVREVAEMVNSDIHPGQASVTPKFFLKNLTEPEVRAQRKRWFEFTLPSLEKMVFKQSDYAVGNSFTLADIFVIPVFVKSLKVGVEPQKYPAFIKHIQNCLAHEKVRSSCPKDLQKVMRQLNLN